MDSKTTIEGQDNQDQVSNPHYEHKIDESFKSKALKWVIWALRMKNNPELKKKLETGLTSAREQPEPIPSIMKNYNVTKSQIDGKNVFTIVPKENKAKKQIIYIHGGSYVFNTSVHQWGFIEALIKETNCTVIAPDYPMAPQHTYVDAYKFMESVYKKIISEVDPNDLVILGDSAGGGFALGFVQKLKQDGLPQPSHVILVSPWLDITCTNPELQELDKDDMMLNVTKLKMAAEAYTKGGDINSHLVCPINGPLEGLPKISVFIGTHDILYADSKKFKSICDQKGIAINYYVYPKMVHVWLALRIPESDHAIQQMKSIIF